MQDLTKLRDEYVETLIDGMDWKDTQQLAREYLQQNVDGMTDQEFIETVREVYPELLENDNEG